MLQGWVIVATSFAYLGLLFAIAYYADKRADAGRSIIASPYVYSLSLAVSILIAALWLLAVTLLVSHVTSSMWWGHRTQREVQLPCQSLQRTSKNSERPSR